MRGGRFKSNFAPVPFVLDFLTPGVAINNSSIREAVPAAKQEQLFAIGRHTQ